jgi:hypothetical protein
MYRTGFDFQGAQEEVGTAVRVYGEVIASSEGYKTKASAENGIKSVQTNAPGATVVDKTG